MHNELETDADERPDSPDASEARYQALLGSLEEFSGKLALLRQEAVRQCTPVVDSLIASRSRDVQAIEQVLDALLDCCDCASGIALFKRLCRYYYEIDPAATADYVASYRDLWEPQDENPTAKK